MASYLFQFLNGISERIGADRVDYDEAERMFRAVCDKEGIVFLVPADNVLSVRKNPPIVGEMTVDLYVDDSKLREAIGRALQSHDQRLARTLTH